MDKTSGQLRPFLLLAAQYKLKEADFTIAGGDDTGAAEAFAKNKADALFRTGPLLSPDIMALVRNQGAVFLPVDNGAAMHIRNPEYSVSTIPKGTYSLNPLIPSSDVPTVHVQRLLLARQDADPDAIAAITKILLTHRQELAAAISSPESQWVQPLVARIRQPGPDTGIVAPLHPGAMLDYEAKEGSFVANHANLLAIIFAICLFLTLLTLELRRHFAHVKKRRADAYNLKVATLMEAAYRSDSAAPVAAELLEVFAAAVKDLEHGKLTSEAFQPFHTIWKAAMDAAMPGQRIVGNWQSSSSSAAPSASGGGGSKWNLAKYLQPRSNS